MSTFRMEFVNLQNLPCKLDITVNDSASNIINIAGGTRPFVLREFNTDMDYYKPIRPMQAEIQILAADGLDVDVFINATDVSFYYGGTLYWYGKVIQDEFQEYWIDTEHIFTIRATDNFDKELSYPYKSGQVTFFDALGYCYGTGSLQLYQSRIVNNMYYNGMTDSATYMPLSQCYFNQKTLMTSVSQTEDAYEVVKKINRAWLQTMFQYQGKWWFFRMEEPLNNPTNFRGVIWTPLAPGGNSSFSTRWDYNIGVSQSIKPIETSMLKTINRQTQYDKISIQYREFENIIINQDFVEGTLESYIPGVDYTEIYTIDDWDLKDFSGGGVGWSYPGTTVTPSGANYKFRHWINYQRGAIKDEYGFITNSSTTVKRLGAMSLPFYAQEGQLIQLFFDFRSTYLANQRCGILYLRAYNGDEYFLKNDGRWSLYNPGTGTGFQGLNMVYAATESADQWKQWHIARDSTNPNSTNDILTTSDPIPASGDMYFYLYNDQANETYYKDVQIKMFFAYTSREISGNYSKYTQSNSLKKYEDEIYFDDMLNGQYKGAIFFDGDLTEANKWYRYQFKPETFSFKQCNAIGQYLLHRRPRMKLDGKFYGLNGTTNPIGLHQTFIFTDDAPTKQFMILNLNEIDFYAATWSATLIETYDTDIDDNDPANYDPYTTGFVYK